MSLDLIGMHNVYIYIYIDNINNKNNNNHDNDHHHNHKNNHKNNQSVSLFMWTGIDSVWTSVRLPPG